MVKDGAQAPALEIAPTRSAWDLIRRKGYIGPRALTVLTVLGVLPLFFVLCRSISLPGESLVFLAPFRALGEILEQSVSLDWIPPADRDSILYLLLLPTGALMVTFVRLTLGVRIMGFRAILIAIGFKASGFAPSVALLVVVVGTILAIRPWVRQIRLPLYARIALIMCLAVSIMVGALLLAPQLQSEAIWGAAFFPVIILAMLAEGIAKTLEQDNAVTAAWRASWTVAVALAIVGANLVMGPVMLQFPELILTELVAILLIAEFLDLRLLEVWPERLTHLIAGTRPWSGAAKPKIAVVRNQGTGGVIGRLGNAAPPTQREHSVQRPVDALREQGFEVKVLEGDVTLLKTLAEFLPSDPMRGTPGGIVLNLATGVQGEGRFSHVPAMLEMAGIPYTGPGPIALSRLSDRFTLLTLLEQASVRVPGCRVLSDPGDTVDLSFPLSVRPRFEPDAPTIVVRNAETLQTAVAEIRRHYAQPTLVEEVVRGRSIHASILGNARIECLPLVETAEKDDTMFCPAPITESHAERLRDSALKAYVAAGCRDYALVDVRLSTFGEPVVVDIRWAGILDRRGVFVSAATAAGYTFPALVRRILDEAARRYLAAATARAAPRAATPDAGKVTKVAPLAERTAASE